MDEVGGIPRRVGVLGSGEVGQRLAGGFAGRGADVVLGTREPGQGSLASRLAAESPRLRTGTFADAAQHGELLVLAVLGIAVESAIDLAGPEHFAGKVVIDATNPLDFSGGMPPTLAWAHTDSGGEHVQRAVPDARVVKAFNTIGNPYFINPSFANGTPAMFIAGDDEAAKATVTAVLTEFGWHSTVDVGGIKASRLLEQLCLLWVAIGISRGAWDHGFSLLTG